jgi:hypothetical protein
MKFQGLVVLERMLRRRESAAAAVSKSLEMAMHASRPLRFLLWIARNALLRERSSIDEPLSPPGTAHLTNYLDAVV